VIFKLTSTGESQPMRGKESQNRNVMPLSDQSLEFGSFLKNQAKLYI
jgi:hypothetical protein